MLFGCEKTCFWILDGRKAFLPTELPSKPVGPVFYPQLPVAFNLDLFSAGLGRSGS